MTARKTIGIVILSILLMGSAYGKPSGSCAKVKVSGSDRCENAVVEFDLSECGDAGGKGTVHCGKKGGEAQFRTKNARYSVRIEKALEGWSKGNWVASGNVKSSSLLRDDKTEVTVVKAEAAAEKKEAPREAPKEAPVEVKKTEISEPAKTEAQKSPPSESQKTLKVTGSARLRYESNRFTDYAGDKEYASMRMRAELQYAPREDLTVFFQPQFSKYFGEQVYTGSSATANTAQQTSGSTVDPSLSVHQAYVDYAPAQGVSLTAGRQVFSYGNELVIGALDWNNVGRSFDAVRARAKYSGGSSDVFVSKIVDDNISSEGNGDKDFAGVYNSWDFGSWAKAFDLYALYTNDSTGTTLPASLWTLGARAQSSVGHFDYRAEYTKQLGKQQLTKTHAQQLDVELGYLLQEGTKTRLSAEGFTASSGYNQLYATAHKWLGYADIFGRRNIQGYAAHFSTNMASRLNLAFDYHDFYRVSTQMAAYKLNGTSTLGNAAASSAKHLGSEYDLTLKHQMNESSALSFGASIFSSGEFLKSQFGTKSPQFYFLQFEAKF